MKPRVLVKVGTNVLTRKNGRLDYNIIADLVDQIVTLSQDYQLILVSSGAAGAGREVFDFKDVKDPLIRKQMLASVGQGRLFQVYADLFRESSVFPAQALLTKADFRRKESFTNIKNTLEELVNHGVLPIINENDVVSFAESSFGDNDQLAALTAIMMGVDLLVILSDIQGFFTADPNLDPNATLIPVVEEISQELMELCQDSLSSGGTGGMLSKVKAAELATGYGIPTIVTAGKREHSLIQAVTQKQGGTLFKTKKPKAQLGDKGNWITMGAETKGVLTVDSGAIKALKDNKSLLAVGLQEISGEFTKKEVVLIQSQEGIRIGAGLSNFDAKEMQAWLTQGEKPQNCIVIHKNHLYRY